MKKLLAILGVITCMVGLCACGKEEAQPSADNAADEMIIQQFEAMVEQFNTIVSQDAVEQFTEDKVIYNALVDWQNALDDIGTFNGTGGGYVVRGEEDIVIGINVTGSSHNAVMEFVLTSDMTALEGVSTNIEYTVKENMWRAFMNTLIGYGHCVRCPDSDQPDHFCLRRDSEDRGEVEGQGETADSGSQAGSGSGACRTGGRRVE